MNGGRGDGKVHLGPLFVQMALLYPWATKEYLLWNMSLAQIIMYHYLGMERKYPKQEGQKRTASNMSYDELRRVRDELRNQYGRIN